MAGDGGFNFGEAALVGHCQEMCVKSCIAFSKGKICSIQKKKFLLKNAF